MKKCKVCGKEIPDNLTYCSHKCAEEDKIHSGVATAVVTTAATTTFLTQWDRGSGSSRRESNIRRVMDMLKDGMSEDEIRFQLSILFRDVTVDSYLRVAKEWLKRESKGS
jgi:alkaline phosphatase